MLSTRDLSAALDVAHALAGDDDLPAALGDLGALIGCDTVSCTEVDHADPSVLTATVGHGANPLLGRRGFAAAAAGHPGFAAFADGRLVPGSPAALTDMATGRELRALPVYVDHYLPTGIRDQLLSVARLGDRRGSVLVLGRSGVRFSDRDRALAARLTPHLARALERQRRLAVRTASASRLTVLTPRERQVAELVARGHTDRRIARHLGISIRTVHKHLENTYRRTGLHGRTALALAVHPR